MRCGNATRVPGATAVPSNRVLVRNLDPRTDFGRFRYRTPIAVLEPGTVGELAECVRAVATAGMPFTVRGSGHSTDGQVLIEDGIVISTTRLRRLIADCSATECLTVEGGTLWSQVCRYLSPRLRRPLVVTGNLLSTVGGTLSAGGVGTSSFVHGAQIATVTKLVLVLASGEVVTVGPQDELFAYALGGVGQLAIIAQAQFRTQRRPPNVLMWHLDWPSLDHFCDAAIRLREYRIFDVLRTRFYYRTATQAAFVDGYAGVFRDEPAGTTAIPPSPALPGSAMTDPWREVWPADAIPDEDRAPEATQANACPALRFSLPVPSGLSAWRGIERELERADLTRLMRTGSSVSLVRVDRTFPLAPLTDSGDCVFIGLHPEMPRHELPRALPTLRAIADRVLDAGGKLDLTSLRPSRDAAARQLGPHLRRFRELKGRIDPAGLLNPGVFGQGGGRPVAQENAEDGVGVG